MAFPLISRVITPAASPGLITIAEAKVVLGVPPADTSQDAIITAQIDAVSAGICNYCDRSFVVQTYRDTFRQIVSSYGDPLRARQYPIAEAGGVPTLFTVTVDGGVIDPARYDLDLANGRVYLLDSGWAGVQLLLDYTAGFDPIPPDVKAATNEWLTSRWSSKGRDPAIRSETIPDVITVVYRDDPAATGGGEGPPSGVCDWLEPYKLRFV